MHSWFKRGFIGERDQDRSREEMMTLTLIRVRSAKNLAYREWVVKRKRGKVLRQGRL
jgi:hypothetical protein